MNFLYVYMGIFGKKGKKPVDPKMVYHPGMKRDVKLDNLNLGNRNIEEQVRLVEEVEGDDGKKHLRQYTLIRMLDGDKLLSRTWKLPDGFETVNGHYLSPSGFQEFLRDAKSKKVSKAYLNTLRSVDKCEYDGAGGILLLWNYETSEGKEMVKFNHHKISRVLK